MKGHKLVIMKNKARLPIVIAISVVVGILLGVFVLHPTADRSKDLGLRFNTLGYKFQSILELISRHYVEDVAIDTISDEALRLLMKQLDPHSSYLTAEESAKEKEAMSGEFEGIGIQFRIINDTITVIQTIQGGPSHKAGLLAGDRIVMVNDTVRVGKSITNENVLKWLKGPKGSKVKVGIVRQDISKILSFFILRDVIPTHSVQCKIMLDQKTGYIKLTRFASNTHKELVNAILSLQDMGMKQLVLDLRGNGGGYLDQAVKICNEFLPGGDQIVYTKNKNKILNEYSATETGCFRNGRLFVMIDEYSASASEIVSGALQDNDRALILGRRTFGKGLVQEQRELFDGSAIRLTVAKYHIPSGRCIQRPYSKGNPEEYYEEFLRRYQNGEFEGKDSVSYSDTTVYRTKKGRIVYGGGGIEPDVFIPYEKTENDPLFYELLRKGILYKYCFNYADNHRSSLKQYRTGKDFIDRFHVSQAMEQEMLAYARTQGLNIRPPMLKKHQEEVKILMKAYIAQNLYEADDVFYEIYLPIDPDMQKLLPLL